MKRQLLVKDIMTENVFSIKQEVLLSQAIHLMLRYRVNSLPVVNDNEELIGLITIDEMLETIKKFFISFDDREKIVESLSGLKVVDIMNKKPVTLEEELPITDVIKISLGNNVYSLPVVKDNKLVGIIGKHDILNDIFFSSF